MVVHFLDKKISKNSDKGEGLGKNQEIVVVNRVIVLLVIAVIVSNCRPVQKPNDGSTKTNFAEMTLADQLKYLDSVLVQQIERLKKYRLNREADMNFRLGLQTNLTVSVKAVRNGPSVPQLKWQKIVADRIEIIRCQVENIITQDKVTGRQDFSCKKGAGNGMNVADSFASGNNQMQCTDFEELLVNPQKYNYLRCDRVLGKIREATSLLDYGASNGFKYRYFLRPCIDNYTLVTNTNAGEAHERCGRAELRKIDRDKQLNRQQPMALVKKHCDPRPQICVDQISESQPFSYNQGQSNKPQLTNLFAERDRVQSEIDNHLQQMSIEGYNVLREITAHDTKNRQRVDRQQEIAKFATLVSDGLSILVNKYDKSLNQGQNCMATIQRARERYAPPGGTLPPDQEQQAYLKCLEGNVKSIININDARKDGTVDSAAAGFAMAEIVVNMLPLENSYLAKDDSGTAISKAIYGIFAGKDTFFRQHCRPCLDHVAEVKRHFKSIEILQIELMSIHQQIATQLFINKKGG